MRILIFILFSLTISPIFGQEIGSVKSGKHSIKLLKLDDAFLMVYSDTNSKDNSLLENTIQFNIVESMYAIIMDGFKNNNSHQVIILASNDTIVKFEYQHINGEKLVKIRQNNLAIKTSGKSALFNKEEIAQLFGVKLKV